MKSATTWFEIAVTDLDRATKFYETTLDQPLKREIFEGHPMAVFRAEEPGVGGALVVDPRLEVGRTGSLVYLNATGQLDACLARVERAGGRIEKGKTGIGPFGFIALIRDTENNLVGLHAGA